MQGPPLSSRGQALAPLAQHRRRPWSDGSRTPRGHCSRTPDYKENYVFIDVTSFMKYFIHLYTSTTYYLSIYAQGIMQFRQGLGMGKNKYEIG